MRTPARLVLPALVALSLAACNREAPPSQAPAAAQPGTAAATTPTVASAARLDTEALRERASASLSANRLYAPAGDNAVEDYLALRERLPGDAAVETALLDLAPYVMIGAEQATAAEDFAEAARLVDLLAAMDEAAPAVPRLREALAGARTAAQDRADAEAAAEATRVEAGRLAAEQAARVAATSPAARAAGTSAPPTPTPPTVAARPAPPPDRPAPDITAPAAATSATTTATPAATERAIVSKVQPRFPETAMRRRLEGVVELQVRVRANGSVESVEVVRAEPANVFDREAVLAVRRWRYAEAEAATDTRVVLRFRRPP